jgi:hypothetical protein
VAFIPFPTKVLGENMLGGDADMRTAALFFNASFTLMAIFYSAFWFTASIGNRLIVKGEEKAAAEIDRRFWPGVPGYLTATIVAIWSVPASLAINGALAIFYLLPRRQSA